MKPQAACHRDASSNHHRVEMNNKQAVEGNTHYLTRVLFLLYTSVSEAISNISLGDAIVIFHYTFSSFVVASGFLLARREFLRAKESWLRASERIKSEEDKHSWEVGEEGQQANASVQLEVGDEVVHADLGRGVVLESKPNHVFRVEFEGMNDFRDVDVKNLLFIGMRVRHGSRGYGTIEKFDENDRVHVNFDSGEYHRYKFESWKKKMVPSSYTRAARYSSERQSFRKFLYDYLLYRTDYYLTTFTFGKPLVLLLSTYTLIVVGASAYSKASGKSTSESLWVAWTMVADPGTHADETGTSARIVALTLTLGGMLVFALMIGIIADGVSSLLDGLKQGNSLVIESGHTLVLGWSDKTLPFVREICLANESLGGGVIVILAERPKAEMEIELMKDLSTEEAKGTLVICRSGNPTNQSDLRKVSAGSARSVVVLADNKLDPDESDARVVRGVLSLHGIRKSRMGHVVVEMCDVDNRDLALLADSKNVEVVVAHDLIGRLMIQCAREPGLAQILDEMMGFEGDEFYIKEWPGMFEEGTTFGEILFRFEDAIPLGIKPHDRRDAYEQIKNSAWRKQSLIRRGWDGGSSVPNSRDNNYSGGEEEDFALRQGSSRHVPVINHFDHPDDDAAALRKSPFTVDGSSDKTRDDENEDDDNDEYVGDFHLDSSGGGGEEETKRSRAVILNPPNDYVLREKDAVLVLAEDDDSYSPKRWEELPKSARLAFDSMLPAHRPSVQTRPERFLFCGWRRDMDDMILELDQLVGPGSEVTIMCMTPVAERTARFEQGGLDVTKLKNLSIRHVMGNPILRRDLLRLPNKLESYGSVLILADQALETNVSSADSRSLASLLLIRDMISKSIKRQQQLRVKRLQLLEKTNSFNHSEGDLKLNTTMEGGGGGESPSFVGGAGGFPPSPASESVSPGRSPPPRLGHYDSMNFTSSRRIALQSDYFVRRPSSVGAALFFENAHNTGSTVLISEILDSKTKALVPVAQIGDHVMSNEIVAATLAMVSECRDISVILSELLQADGNDLHIRSALDYGFPGEKIDFWQLQARARARGEIAIGYKSTGDKVPTLNPREKCAKITLSAKGTVIVIAED